MRGLSYASSSGIRFVAMSLIKPACRCSSSGWKVDVPALFHFGMWWDFLSPLSMTVFGSLHMSWSGKSSGNAAVATFFCGCSIAIRIAFRSRHVSYIALTGGRCASMSNDEMGVSRHVPVIHLAVAFHTVQIFSIKDTLYANTGAPYSMWHRISAFAKTWRAFMRIPFLVVDNRRTTASVFCILLHCCIQCCLPLLFLSTINPKILMAFAGWTVIPIAVSRSPIVHTFGPFVFWMCSSSAFSGAKFMPRFVAFSHILVIALFSCSLFPL